MPKNIILLSDGTGNSASKLFKTNVWRLYQALDLSQTPAPGKPTQIACYDDGVGTASFMPLAILGGAFGWGTKRNVLDLYTFLCRHYKDENNEADSIYGFGFSRGAFTIRMLVGFIKDQGLVQANTEGELRHLAAEAFRAYRKNRYPGFIPNLFRPLRKVLLKLFYGVTRRKQHGAEAERKHPRIKFLGLWDTVAAYGLPIDELTHAWNFIFPLSFPDRKLSEKVDCAYHAMAIDDERLSFHPEVWDEGGEDGRLTQVWFAGMHSNLGGGYPDDALSGVPLNWILDKAEQEGLNFLPDERQRLREMACVNGKQYDSRQGVGGLYRYKPRNLKDLLRDDRDKNHVAKIHESVLTRIKNRVDGYAPIGLPEQYKVVAANANGAILPQPETEAQAKDRANRQRKIWNLVWWKRLVYFITVGVFILLAAFPFIYPPPTPYAGRLAVLSKLIASIGAFLPSFLNKWLVSYQAHPGAFLVVASVFAGILYLASRLQDRIFDKMRSVFDNPLHAGSTPAKQPRDVIYKLHSNRLLRKSSKFLKEKLIPTLILVFVAMFLLRVVFTILDSAGFVSRPTTDSNLAKGDFDTTNLSWPSRVQVEEGKRYQITLTINKPWLDSTIPATTGGVEKKDIVPVMYLALPFRRHISEPWFKPIARIGRYGNDDYPLDPVPGTEANKDCLVAEITARRSGELFLFVNDAVLPVPRAWQKFYNNNQGTASVKVEEWKDNGSWVEVKP